MNQAFIELNEFNQAKKVICPSFKARKSFLSIKIECRQFDLLKLKINDLKITMYPWNKLKGTFNRNNKNYIFSSKIDRFNLKKLFIRTKKEKIYIPLVNVSFNPESQQLEELEAAHITYSDGNGDYKGKFIMGDQGSTLIQAKSLNDKSLLLSIALLKNKIVDFNVRFKAQWPEQFRKLFPENFKQIAQINCEKVNDLEAKCDQKFSNRFFRVRYFHQSKTFKAQLYGLKKFSFLGLTALDQDMDFDVNLEFPYEVLTSYDRRKIKWTLKRLNLSGKNFNLKNEQFDAQMKLNGELKVSGFGPSIKELFFNGDFQAQVNKAQYKDVFQIEQFTKPVSFNGALKWAHQKQNLTLTKKSVLKNDEFNVELIPIKEGYRISSLMKNKAYQHFKSLKQKKIKLIDELSMQGVLNSEFKSFSGQISLKGRLNHKLLSPQKKYSVTANVENGSVYLNLSSDALMVKATCRTPSCQEFRSLNYKKNIAFKPEVNWSNFDFIPESSKNFLYQLFEIADHLPRSSQFEFWDDNNKLKLTLKDKKTKRKQWELQFNNSLQASFDSSQTRKGLEVSGKYSFNNKFTGQGLFTTYGDQIVDWTKNLILKEKINNIQLNDDLKKQLTTSFKKLFYDSRISDYLTDKNQRKNCWKKDELVNLKIERNYANKKNEFKIKPFQVSNNTVLVKSGGNFKEVKAVFLPSEQCLPRKLTQCLRCLGKQKDKCGFVFEVSGDKIENFEQSFGKRFDRCFKRSLASHYEEKAIQALKEEDLESFEWKSFFQ